MLTRTICLLSLSIFILKCSPAQEPHEKVFTRQDTLRGSIGPGRDWWNVTRYQISVKPDYDPKTISGKNIIGFTWLKPSPSNGFMQIDLQEPMQVDSIIYHGQSLKYQREGNAWMIKWPATNHATAEELTVYFHGKPREATNPPWDGGWIWKRDKQGRPWMSVACQGLGASVWYPCKDHQSDEPDSGATLTITVPDTLSAIGNGRLQQKQPNNNGTTSWTWKVVNPINNYNIIPYIGFYTHWHEVFSGEKGALDCDYWVLDYNLDKAKAQFTQVPKMLKCFEYWYGPYPFYEDGYKLVESPHLGMEHQSAVAYGNGYQNGYRGRDLSGTGQGLKWDFIIVHESGHEWFANSITTNDMADMWVHEGFTNYSETLYTTCEYGVAAGNEYCIGSRKNIENKTPIIPHYGVNEEGSVDMYAKGGNLLHTIRQVIGDDEKFRQILRGLNTKFYHKTVDSRDIEEYISRQAGRDLSKAFDQYLRTTKIPVLEYSTSGNQLRYHWTNCVPGFDLPLKVKWNGKEQWIYPTANDQTLPGAGELVVDPNFYITVKKID